MTLARVAQLGNSIWWIAAVRELVWKTDSWAQGKCSGRTLFAASCPVPGPRSRYRQQHRCCTCNGGHCRTTVCLCSRESRARRPGAAFVAEPSRAKPRPATLPRAELVVCKWVRAATSFSPLSASLSRELAATSCCSVVSFQRFVRQHWPLTFAVPRLRPRSHEGT